jgi:hypothetical protein
MSVIVPVNCENTQIEIEFFEHGSFDVHGYDIEEAKVLEEMGYDTPECLAFLRRLSQRTLRFLLKRVPLDPYELMITYLLDCLQHSADYAEFDEFIPWMDQVAEAIRELGTEGEPLQGELYEEAIGQYRKFKEWWTLEYGDYISGERAIQSGFREYGGQEFDGNYMAYLNDIVKAHLRWILGMAIDQDPKRAWDPGGMGFPKLYHFVDAMAKGASYFRVFKEYPEITWEDTLVYEEGIWFPATDAPQTAQTIDFHERFFPEERAWQIGRYVKYLEGTE